MLIRPARLRDGHGADGYVCKDRFKRWLTGSVSHRVIPYATSVVTVVR